MYTVISKKRFVWQSDVIQLLIEHFQPHSALCSVLPLVRQTVTEKKDY